MTPPRITYGPFGFRWGFVGIALVAGAMAVGMVILQRDIRRGSQLRCERLSSRAPQKPQRPGEVDGRLLRCTSRKGSRSRSFNLEGVRGARIGRQHKTETYEVYLTYADGSTQRVLPNGRAVQLRFGSTDKVTALEAVRRFELFLNDPSQRRLELILPAATSTVVFMGVACLLLGLVFLYALFHALRAMCCFTIERSVGPHTLTVKCSLLSISLGTRTLNVADVTRVAVERMALDRLLGVLDIKSAQGGRIALYDDDTDVPLAHLTRAPYPGTRQHDQTAEALRSLLA